jgi:hypothetical protein
MPRSRNPQKPYSRAHRGTVGSRQALVELPGSGCDLPVPDMPEGRTWGAAERARWTELWSSPQATQWDETARGSVACLVIYETAIFTGAASAWQAQEARYASESLGLTPRSLTALGWRICD